MDKDAPDLVSLLGKESQNAPENVEANNGTAGTAQSIEMSCQAVLVEAGADISAETHCNIDSGRELPTDRAEELGELSAAQLKLRAQRAKVDALKLRLKAKVLLFLLLYAQPSPPLLTPISHPSLSLRQYFPIPRPRP